MGTCYCDTEPPPPDCDPQPVTATCSIAAGARDNAALSGICGAPTGGGGDPQITMTEVGRVLSGQGVLCPDAGIAVPEDTVTVDVSGLQTGCVLFAHVVWGETDNDISGCGSGLGATLTVQGTSGGVGTENHIYTDVGYDFYMTSLGHSAWWFPVTADGNGSITFHWPAAFGSPLAGASQIQVFQVCGDIDASDPVSGHVTGGIDAPANHPEGTQLGPETISLPAGDCPGIYLAGSRHADFVGNSQGQANGGFHVENGATEVAEYVAIENTDYCQMGQAGGTIEGDSFDAYSAMNITNYYGDITDQSMWVAVRLNCTTPDPEPTGGEETVGQCCRTITNHECNDELSADVSFTVDVDVVAAPGSDFTVQLLHQGGVVDFVQVADGSQSVTLTHSTVTAPVPPLGTSEQQCYAIKVVCDGYTTGVNDISWGTGTTTMEITL